MKKLLIITVSIVVVMMSAPAGYVHAGSFNFKIGLVQPSMESDLWEINMANLAFEKQDMQSTYFGLEFEHFFGRHLSLSIEGGYYEKEHYSMYRDFVFEDDSPIYQNLALRITSLELDFKFYPVGHRTKFYPYLGGGAGIYRWKYEQWGDFVDAQTWLVSEDEYVESSAYTPGFNGKAGFVVRFSRYLGVSFEARYLYLKGDLSAFFEGFEKLDMSGFTYSLGLNLFFR
ncbi:MAG: hypothetical protein GTO45_12675 [Candidatus Aminicenantes bacterium]|nr:hypothetical protein [Candidatus Aminicenantes bacterium]NIM79639.1 hypothetical protein [Candidatus Aminicenantes bacterium]NIN18965.1 hypothetical protein [Candidatus Aminicenantes bacterium]NIN42867.1 hypothetical protein [Candidatus Aminicenantes bacterium]NIN85604.1 hypothetical protein [Candidatus Aminicenantes bacterium]